MNLGRDGFGETKKNGFLFRKPVFVYSGVRDQIFWM